MHYANSPQMLNAKSIRPTALPQLRPRSTSGTKVYVINFDWHVVV